MTVDLRKHPDQVNVRLEDGTVRMMTAGELYELQRDRTAADPMPAGLPDRVLDAIERDPFDQLDRALADVRLASRWIREAVEASAAGRPCATGESWGAVISQLAIAREKASDRVTVLLRATVVELPECLR